MTEEELELRRAHARLSLDENQPRVIDPATGLKGYTHLTLEQQTSILIDKLTIMLAELDALVKQIEIPETASRKMHLILQCLPIYVQRPRQQLRAIANKFPDFACDPSIAVLAFADGALIWVDGALDVARPIAAKDTVPLGIALAGLGKFDNSPGDESVGELVNKAKGCTSPFERDP
jgi:hypothetical protein